MKEHQIFLDLDFTKEIKPYGMDITLVTSAPTDEECKALLKAIGLPLRELEAKN